MKKIFILLLMTIFVSSCAASNRVVTLGNVSVLSPTGEKLRNYNNVILQEVPVADTLSSIYFVEQDGTEHYIKNSIVVVEGVEQIVESNNVTVTTSVVMYPYDYYYPYSRVYYYQYPYRNPRPRIEPRPVPRPEPRPQPRTEPQTRPRPEVRPAPRPNQGLSTGPRPNGPSGRPTPPNNHPGRR